MDVKKIITPKLIAWELTRSCNLSCAHCRASSKRGPYKNELSKEECFKVLDDIASFAKPVMILTGGEPLLRLDIFEIAEYAAKCGLSAVMAPNGTLLTDENACDIIKSGIKRISISLDGQTEDMHDNLRQVPGAFKGALRGMACAKKAGLQFQINSTITKRNVLHLTQIMNLVKDLGAVAHHIFLLVPTGRAKEMIDEELSPSEYEATLELLAEAKGKSGIEIKVTCAPHFNRILLQKHPELAQSLRGRGCMAATGFCFISHTGDLQPCGYFEVKCGNVREGGFKKHWFESEVFNDLRDFGKYKGKCGICEFNVVCGGCRARALAKYGDYLREEPYCTYQPKKQ